MIMPVTTLAEAEAFLLSLGRSKSTTFKDGFGLERTRHFLQLLGNPQDSFPSLHIAGTSGKGTTVYLIGALLRAAGKKVGVHVSPHIYDVRERMEVDGNIITEDELCQHINSLGP